MSTALKHLTTDEFLLWAEGRQGRWELHDGVPVLKHASEPASIPPERAAHVRAKFSAARALQEALKGVNLPCEVFSDGLSVKIDAQTTFEPDATVVCGQQVPDDAIVISNAIIVVEVLSPSTAAIDHGRKLSGYFSLPSVEHYLILDPERRVVIHHKRGQGDAIETRVLSEGSAKLDPPGFEVAVEALFPPDCELEPEQRQARIEVWKTLAAAIAGESPLDGGRLVEGARHVIGAAVCGRGGRAERQPGICVRALVHRDLPALGLLDVMLVARMPGAGVDRRGRARPGRLRLSRGHERRGHQRRRQQ